MLTEILRFRIVHFGYDVPESRSLSLRLQVLIEVIHHEQTIKEPEKLP